MIYKEFELDVVPIENMSYFVQPIKEILNRSKEFKEICRWLHEHKIPPSCLKAEIHKDYLGLRELGRVTIDIPEEYEVLFLLRFFND